ncbi:hypothetical protein [Vibrio chagasii]|uniref:hypothetical protein n=1 Tax=Vibrio chagasii TaxID=170679 RepID=UPI001476EC3F|nr:hypothetical protein [Vibrio chagasii]
MKETLQFNVMITYETDEEGPVICPISAKENLIAAIENERVNGALNPDDISATEITIT